MFLTDCLCLQFLVPNSIDVFTTAASGLSETRAMNRRTFFGFGFGLDRQTAYDTISQQLLLCRQRGNSVGGGAGTGSGEAEVVPVIYLVSVFSHGDVSIPLSCVLCGTRSDSGERTLGVAKEQSFALECTDLGELTTLRIWPADEAQMTTTALSATFVANQYNRQPLRMAPRLSIERVVVQRRTGARLSSQGAVSSGSSSSADLRVDSESVAIFTETRNSKVQRRGALELARESESEAFRQATSAKMVLDFEEEVWENQRRPALSLRPMFAAAELTLVERGPWSDAEGRPRIKRNVALPVGWEWASAEWVVDTVSTLLQSSQVNLFEHF